MIKSEAVFRKYCEQLGYLRNLTAVSICGFMFLKGRMKVTVSKILKMNQGKADVEAISQSYLVELSVLAPSGQNAIAEEIKNFAEQLKPLVQLEKINYSRQH
ncbi:mediator of RNA polymerase II transcription subunit 18-like [Copidosoma floridanum]|uniref:mediator of RNA polymerase II transcription subunit 18-like n=1 Tax=Copidosoma floridanum TaxID=29053 RepID=UPI000C6F507A|nr:mediator of RNA polymerase II transcription subunit 18-like [Copidosoma floridanum]